MFNLLTLQWPDLLEHSPFNWAVCLRNGQRLRAEALVTSQMAVSPSDALNGLAPLALICLQSGLHNRGLLLAQRLFQADPPDQQQIVRVMKLLFAQDDVEPFSPARDQLIPADHWSLLGWVVSCQLAIRRKDEQSAARILEKLRDVDLPEACVARAWYLRAKGELRKAFDAVAMVFERAPHLSQPALLGLEIAMQGEMSDVVLPSLRSALNAQGEHPALLGIVTSTNLLRRQNGLARRSSLLQRCWASVDGRNTQVDNHLVTYEANGLSAWLEHVHPQLTPDFDVAESRYRHNLHANRALQLASLASNKGSKHLQDYIPLLRHSLTETGFLRAAGSLRHRISNPQKLHIAWLTSDFGSHPVGRFLLGFLESSQGVLKHHHTVLSTYNRGDDSFADYVNSFPDVSHVDVSSYSSDNRVKAIRRLKPDILLDLNGWTSGQVIPELMSRLAPIQVNYLGYFASTGLSEIDYWLGDDHLFPHPMREWHTESIWRLKRPFLAWQPSRHLPEANAPVTKPPTGSIRFGSFNHTRKFSDRNLRLWGRILQALPDAQLVLKAHASSDPSSQTLLLRRMHRAGLPVDRLVWLPLTQTTDEHLQQYAELDIALDCLPNGGCTTTCEALWMGVPVITLAGDHYVSRMSTSVLHGADCGDWVADTEDAYVALACYQASQIHQLRSDRSQWRLRLQQSPLGDARSLMHALEQAFTTMAVQHLSSSCSKP